MLKRKQTNTHDSQSKRHRVIKVNNEILIDGLLVMKNMEAKLIESHMAANELNLDDHQLRFTSSVKIESSETLEEFFSNLKLDLEECFTKNSVQKLSAHSLAVDSVLLKYHSSAAIESSNKNKSSVKHLLISWKFEDDILGSQVLDFLMPSTETTEFD